MKKEHYHVSPMLSMQISELGIRWKADFYWHYNRNKGYHLVENRLKFKNNIPAYTLTELGHLIPFGFFNKMVIQKLLTTYFQVKLGEIWETYCSEVDARARYLVWLFETKQVSLAEIKTSSISTTTTNSAIK